MSHKRIKIEPATLDIDLYGDGHPWAVELHMPALGDLTGATFEAKFRPTTGASGELDVTTTAEGLAESKFSIGAADTVAGRFDVAITHAGGTRTYVKGNIRIDPDVAS